MGSCAQVRPAVPESVNPSMRIVQYNLHPHRSLSEEHQRRHHIMDDCTRPTGVYPNLQGGNPTGHFGQR